MYIYNELFQECKSEDELAAVMAHEFAHVYARHVAKGMRRQYITMGAAAAAGGAGYLAGGKEKGGEYAGMAAGAGTELLGGTPTQVAHAVALAQQGTLGLVCDPLGGLVASLLAGFAGDQMGWRYAFILPACGLAVVWLPPRLLF